MSWDPEEALREFESQRKARNKSPGTVKEQPNATPKEGALDFLLRTAGIQKDALLRSPIGPISAAEGFRGIANMAMGEAENPANAQSLSNALQLKPADPGASPAGVAANLGYRYGLPLLASSMFPASSVSGPLTRALAPTGAGAMRSLAAGGIGAIAGAGEQGIAAGGTAAIQNLAAGKTKEQALSAGEETGKAFAAGQLTVDIALGAGPSMLKAFLNRAKGAFKQWYGIPEPITEQLINRGAKNVMTQTNLREDASQNALEDMREAIVEPKKIAGENIGAVEDALVGTEQGKRMFDASGVAQSIRKELKRPIFSEGINEYGGAAAEKAMLGGLAAKLEAGPLTAEELIGLRKNLDKEITWRGGPLQKPSSDLERIIGNVNNDLRGTIHNAFPDTIGAAYDKYSEAKNIYDRYRKVLGGSDRLADNPDIFNDSRAVDALRRNLSKGGATQSDLLKFDQDVARGQNLMQKFFDSIVAKEFSGTDPKMIIPSSLIGKTMASLGLLGPRMGARAIGAAQSLQGPPGVARTLTTRVLQNRLQNALSQGVAQ